MKMESLSSTLKDDFLTCTICYEVFSEPKTLPCLHSFCKFCISGFIKTNELKPPYHCPVCRENFALEVDEIKTNFCLTNMIDLVKKSDELFCSFCKLLDENRPALFQCLTCLDYLCEECAKMRHSFTRQTRNHQVVSMKDIKTGKHDNEIRLAQKTRCSSHTDEILLFLCTSCQAPVCRDCLIYKHREHGFKPIADLRKEKEQKINEIIDPLKKKLEDLQKSSAVLSVEINSCEANENVIVREIEERFSEAIESLRRSQTKLTEDIRNKMKLQKDPLHNAFQNIEKHCKSIEESLTFSANISKGGSDFEILNILDEIYDRVLNLNESTCTKTSECLNLDIPHFKLLWKKTQLLDPSFEQTDILSLEIKTKRASQLFTTNRSETNENNAGLLRDHSASSSLITDKRGISDNLKNVKKKSILNLIKKLNFSDNDDKYTPVYSSVTWTPDGRVVAIDKENEKVKSLTLSSNSRKSIKFPRVLSISSNLNGFLCRTQIDSQMFIMNRQLEIQEQHDGVSTIVCTSPNDNASMWMTRDKIFTKINGNQTKMIPISDDREEVKAFGTPTYACYLPNNTFAVSDFDRNCVFLINNSGKIVRKILHRPGSISCDSVGNMFIADFLNNSISVFDVNGLCLSICDIGMWQTAPRCISVFKNRMLVAGDNQIIMYAVQNH
ncbi:E3 ubiquitin-protein ligase TRIM56-like [Saccostrea echinata]|uniref:E3 ubiquitin-protein ligase TRIM56-like n=1 Tax=Saccostrea echinata TaxID=191078 RepID=UPI002A803077|nr:E3 ubiquitin-protein ligase TRIM56-like [Saccostrea echinata]